MLLDDFGSDFDIAEVIIVDNRKQSSVTPLGSKMILDGKVVCQAVFSEVVSEDVESENGGDRFLFSGNFFHSLILN